MAHAKTHNSTNGNHKALIVRGHGGRHVLYCCIYVTIDGCIAINILSCLHATVQPTSCVKITRLFVSNTNIMFFFQQWKVTKQSNLVVW